MIIGTSQGMIRSHQGKLSLAHRVSDLLIICFSLLFVCLIYEIPWDSNYSAAVFAAMVFMAVFSERKELYRSWRIKRVLDELLEIYVVWFGVVIGLVFIAFITKTGWHFSRLAICSWFILVPVLFSFSRILIRNFWHALRRRGFNTRTVVIIGINEQGVHLANTMQNASWMGLRFLGFYDDRHQERLEIASEVPILGNFEQLVANAKQGSIDAVYVTMPLRAEERTRTLIAQLSDTTTSIYYIPDVNALNILHGRWIQFGDVPMVSIHENPHYGVDAWLKRTEDIVLSSIILSIIAIPMLFIALGVKFSSAGPVFFKQRRYGINGEEIEVWKFRSMSICEDGAHIQQATKNDIRVTPFGAFLRRTSLDELPQFINVLQGRMSIVGPRPHAVAHNEIYRKQISRYMLRHKVKPGITGWAQINGWRGETDTLDKMEKRVEYDLDYIRNWSITLDLKIFFWTLFKGFKNEKAY